MRFNTIPLAVACALQLIQFSAAAQVAPSPNRLVVVVLALSANEAYDQECAKWAKQVVADLTGKAGFAPAELLLVWPEEQSVEPAGVARFPVTKAGFQDALKRGAAAVQPDGAFYMFVFGSGSFDGRVYKLNLKGPDVEGAEIQSLLGAIRSKRQAILWGTSSSGELLKLLSTPGRVLITATRSGMEHNDPRFPGFFLDALSDPAADTDKDQRVSWLEAFLSARVKTDQTYKDDGHMATEHPLLDDSGDGQGHALPAEENGDGFLAAAVYTGSVKGMPAQAAAANPQLAGLLKQRDQLEGSIQQLKSRRKELTSADYDRQMEDLLVRMAKTSAEIRKLEGAPKP